MKKTVTIETNEVFYPESDGLPMAENDAHRDLIFLMIELLRTAFPQSYVSGDIFVYYKEGVPSKKLSPDVLLCSKGKPGAKGSFKTWEEPPIDLVIEMSSDKSNTKKKDYVRNKRLFAEQLKIPYYVIYNLDQEKLDAFVLLRGQYKELLSDQADRYYLPLLKIYIAKQEPHILRILNGRGLPYLTNAEKADKEAVLRFQETTRAEQESQRAEQESQRAEQEALRADKMAAKLREMGINPDSI